MSGLFIEILNMSLSAGCAALIVILIRVLMKKAPKKYSYILWAVVFFRLACPFTIQLPVSAVPIQPQTIPRDIVYSYNPMIQSGLPVIDSAVNNAIAMMTLPPVKPNSLNPANGIHPVQQMLEVGLYIWLIGVLALLLYGIISYLRLKRKIGTAIRVHDNIFETDLINTPFVLGFVRPKIYLPVCLGEKESHYIIEHERKHIKRLDYLIKPLAFIVASFHWFNPLAWVSYILLTRDMELSADEHVMKRSDVDIRGEYSNLLLALSVKRGWLISPLAFGETGVKKRVKNVLRFKTPAFWVSAIAVVVVITFSLLLFGGSARGGKLSEQSLILQETIDSTNEQTKDIERFLALHNISYKAVDVSNNPIAYGMDPHWQAYDLIDDNETYVLILREDNDFTAVLYSDGRLIEGMIDNGITPALFNKRGYYIFDGRTRLAEVEQSLLAIPIIEGESMPDTANRWGEAYRQAVLALPQDNPWYVTDMRITKMDPTDEISDVPNVYQVGFAVKVPEISESRWMFYGAELGEGEYEGWIVSGGDIRFYEGREYWHTDGTIPG